MCICLRVCCFALIIVVSLSNSSHFPGRLSVGKSVIAIVGYLIFNHSITKIGKPATYEQ